MCDPLTITGIALSGASALANNAAQSRVQGARDDALAAERIRQGTLDSEAAAVNARAQNQYDGFGAKQETRGKQLGDYFTQQTAASVDESGPVALPQSSSNITVQADNKARGEAKAFTDKQGVALGNLRSFGDLMGELGRGTAREAGSIGQIGSFKKGSSAVLPYELEQANGKGGNMALLGDVLGGAGRIATGAGLSGANIFGAPAAGANVALNPMASRAMGGALDRASVQGYAAPNNASLYKLFR